MKPFEKNIQFVEKKLRELAPETQIIAASKYQTIHTIEQTFNAGITNFGENYAQPAIHKILNLKHLPISWHFIGQLQTNKIKLIAKYFDWAHSVCCIKHAELFSIHCKHRMTPLNICIQVSTKSNTPGRCSLDVLPVLMQKITELPHIKLRGLMAMPHAGCTEKEIEIFFDEIQSTYIENKSTFKLDTLCMGMSQDYQLAIARGANMIRLGRLIFDTDHLSTTKGNF